jgi:hypothetical protein
MIGFHPEMHIVNQSQTHHSLSLFADDIRFYDWGGFGVESCGMKSNFTA